MYLKQFYLGCLAHASYLIGDEETKTAVVVDPQRDIAQYLKEAEEHGLSIKHVILTHFHADFVAGHLELRDQAEAKIYLGKRANAEYDFTPLSDGQVLKFGKVLLKTLETPGHTPEAISILVFDLDKSDSAPHAVLTGDTLFIGDVGRPDLMASIGISQTELAGMLYESLHQKLLALPDETLVYPAHGAGSMCGKNLSKDTFSTLGNQRRYNYALQPMSKEQFVSMVTADQPEAPRYFSYDAMLNRKERATLNDTLEQVLKPLSLEQVLEQKENGAQVLDVRDPGDYANSHLNGSINIGLQGQFATWCGTILDREKRIIIIADQEGEKEAAMRLGRIGFDHVAGYLDGGMLALAKHPELVRHITRITAAELSDELKAKVAPLVLDVRTNRERQEMRIEPSLHIPLNHLQERWREVPQGQRIVIHCARGYRSSIASSLLEQQGLTEVTDLIGGIAAWESAQYQTTSSAAPSCS